MKIQYTNKIVTEKAISITLLGVLEAIKGKSISIDEAQAFIFSPRIVTMFRKAGVAHNVLEIIEKGCELEDIELLIPEELDKVIENMVLEIHGILDRKSVV